MSNAPGVPRVVLRYWAAIGFFLLPIGIGHTLLMSPSLVTSAYFVPEIGNYVLFAALAWIIVYTMLTIALFRYSDVESLREFFDAMTAEQKRIILAFILVFVNTVILIGGIGGGVIGEAGYPMIGIVVAVLYPFAELQLAFRIQTPARVVITIAIAIAHAVGAAKDLTPEGFLDSFLGGRRGNTRRASLTY